MKPQVFYQLSMDIRPVNASGIVYGLEVNVIGASIYRIDKSA